jgi:hypothetical protein
VQTCCGLSEFPKSTYTKTLTPWCSRTERWGLVEEVWVMKEQITGFIIETGQ